MSRVKTKLSTGRSTLIALVSGLMLGMGLSGLALAADPQPAPSHASDAVEMPGFPTLPRPTDAPPAGAVPSSAEQTAPLDIATPPVTVFNQSLASTLSVGEMGQTTGLTLSNWQQQSGFTFTLPSDWVVTDGNLVLDLDISPALIGTDTELQLMLNGQPLSTQKLNQLHEGKVSLQVAIPAAMIVARNNLSFSIGNGSNAAMLCERGRPINIGSRCCQPASYIWKTRC